MQRTASVRLAFIGSLVAFIAPLSLSLVLAWKQSQAYEKANVNKYATDVLRRSEKTRFEFQQIVSELRSSGVPPCSAQEISRMRALDLSLSYVQAVVRIQNNTIVCNSLGWDGVVGLGAPTIHLENGASQWLRVSLPIAPQHPLNILLQDGVGAVVDPGLSLDTPTEQPDISLVLFAPSLSDKGILATRGNKVPPNVFDPIPKGGERNYVEKGYVVSIVRSNQTDVAVVAASPRIYLDKRVQQFALIFVPIGLLCGFGMLAAVRYLRITKFSLPVTMRVGLKRNEFFLEYQPIVDIRSQKCTGCEALVRWKNGGEIVRPDQFIPVAEESGLIRLITKRVMELVARDLPKLLAIDPEFRVALNVSANDLSNDDVLTGLRSLLRKSEAKPFNIEIEATERGFLQGEAVLKRIQQIRAEGFRVAIDDFGTGYSSLARLQTLPVDTLKIDKAFIDTIGTDGVTSQVVLHIIEMAHDLNLEMVAEGVETAGQVAFLKQHSVRYLQGWFLGKPMKVESLIEMLRTQSHVEEDLVSSVGE